MKKIKIVGSGRSFKKRPEGEKPNPNKGRGKYTQLAAARNIAELKAWLREWA